MSRDIDSLNVGTAAAIVFAALDRQVPAGWDGS
jgi:tRNA G18 (ribose-2'-O)-methylase SpoU